ncbi:hypothetical protein B0H19DRAFT_1170113 [Mycena capillaripes]|nr:hypothetical protein B0H19DRAFT_1170113 [Mycena capillaripes]
MLSFVNRSLKSVKGSYSMDPVAARPEPSAVMVSLSPIIRDVQSFPTLGDVNSSFYTFSMVGGNPDQNKQRYAQMMPENYQRQEYQDNDSRNFEHMNLSGLQSTSCRDMTCRFVVLQIFKTERQSVPTLVLAFPTPEPPKSPIFAPQTPFTVHKFVAATGPGAASASGHQGTGNRNVPARPHCTQCGFGFGLDLHDLEAPLSSNPYRFCEPQWLTCKMWYQARANSLREPCAVRPAESNASNRAIVGKLGRSYRDAVDELGQMDDKLSHAKMAGEGYSMFSNMNIKYKPRTTKRTAGTVWKKLTRLFGTQDRASDKNGLDLRWIGPSALMS